MSAQRGARGSDGASERGAVAVIFGLCIVVLFGMAAFVIDLGGARQVERKVQASADAGVMAGVQDLPPVGTNAAMAAAARGTAAEYALASLGLNLPATLCPAGGSDVTCYGDGSHSMRVISPVAGNGQVVRIELCEQSVEVFASAIGGTTPKVCKEAEAELLQDVAVAPAILATHPSACGAINTHGNGDVIAMGGAIQVNSTCNSALTQEGSSSELISDTCICVVGGASLQHPGNATPSVSAGANVGSNPYENVPVVLQPASPGSRSGTTYAPGYFNSKIELNEGTYTFLPGIYYLKAGIRVEGKVTIQAHDVLFYIASGGWDIGSGPHTIGISAYTAENTVEDPDGPYDGLAIYQAPTNTNTFHYGDDAHAGTRVGTGCEISPASGIDGGVYVPNAQMHIRGNNSRFCASAPIVGETIQVEEWATFAGTGGANVTAGLYVYRLRE